MDRSGSVSVTLLFWFTSNVEIDAHVFEFVVDEVEKTFRRFGDDGRSILESVVGTVVDGVSGSGADEANRECRGLGSPPLKG